jgi:hypothetical protein
MLKIYTFYVNNKIILNKKKDYLNKKRELKKMKIKSSTLIVILLFSMIPTMIPVMLITPALFGTGTYREELFSALGDTNIKSTSLPLVTPFWVDIVDAELVENEGEGVYIAVLDTGLLEMWPFFFSEANIAWELGKGFSHAVSWSIDDYEFGPLDETRGFITKPDEGSGHGTHVTSTIVGFQYSGSLGNFWVRGVAPEATIIPVLVLDAWWVPDAPYDPEHPGEENDYRYLTWY